MRKKLILYLVALFSAIILLFPVFWMISTSLKSATEAFTYPPVWVPLRAHFDNYIEALKFLPILLFLKNTFIVASLTTLGTLISCSLVAYPLARLRFPAKDILFFVFIGLMLIPPQVTMIPLFILFARLGWVNTWKPLIVPYWLSQPFFVFLLRQFFMSIPKELDDAAKIDGCSLAGIFWRIILPLSKPALLVTAIFSFTWSWNEFTGPLIYLDDIELFVISIGLNLFKTRGGAMAHPEWIMSVATIAALPPIVLFFSLQKYFVKGITLSGIKG